MFTYASLVWWANVRQQNFHWKLTLLQRTALEYDVRCSSKWITHFTVLGFIYSEHCNAGIHRLLCLDLFPLGQYQRSMSMNLRARRIAMGSDSQTSQRALIASKIVLECIIEIDKTQYFSYLASVA